MVFAALFAVLYGAVAVYERWRDWRLENARLPQKDAMSSESAARTRTALIVSTLAVVIAAVVVFFSLIPWGVRFLKSRGVECFT